MNFNISLKHHPIYIQKIMKLIPINTINFINKLKKEYINGNKP
jgi:hypothetical protein